jgi:ELWxxDGT repeat protein
MFKCLCFYAYRILKQEERENLFMPIRHTIRMSCLVLAFTCAIASAAGNKDRTTAAMNLANVGPITNNTLSDSSAMVAPVMKSGLSGPVLLKEINPGEGSSSAEMFVTFNGVVYFRADDGTHGIELWRTDGTPEGTSLVTDLRPGVAHALPGNITVAGGSLYFHAFTEATGSKVFKSDGTAAGTLLLVDTFPGAPGGPFGPPLPGNFTTFGDIVLFTATDGQAGYELWRTDGTIAGTQRLIDLHPGVQWSVPVGLTPFAGRIFFAADDKVTFDPNGNPFFDRELFATDGTDMGTVRVKDIFPGPRPSIPFNFMVFRERLFFTANDGTSGAEMWTTDGTEGGTSIFKEINPTGPSNPMQLTVAGTRLFFNADDGVKGSELWVSDGSEAGTRIVMDINPKAGSLPLNLTAVGDRVFFSADDGQHGIELWVTDGTAAGTHLVKDINPGVERSSPLDLLAVGDVLFFTAIDPDDVTGTVATQLWMTDGTEAGTKLVWEAPGRAFGYSIQNLTLLGNQILFSAPTSADAGGLSINTELYSLEIPCQIGPNKAIAKCKQ